MKARLLVLLAALMPAALALAACGGDSGAEDQITEAIEKVTTTNSPKNCTEYETQRFTEQNDQARGREAIQACEKEAEAGAEKAKAATVSNISVDGETATAQVEFEGGPLGSQAIKMAMVEEEGAWKVDQIEGFADYDGKVLGQAFERQLNENPGKLSPTQIACIGAKIESADKSKAEELFFASTPENIVELAESCG